MFGEVFRIEKILDVCEKILYFLKINFFFLVSNIPVLLFFLFVGISQVRTCLPLFLVCAVFAGPAFAALFFSMNRLLRGLETGAWKDYKTGYTDSWAQKMNLAAILVLLILIFWTNVEFFAVQVPVLPLTIVFAVLFAAVLLMVPEVFLLASRYRLGSREILKDALVLLLTHPAAALGNVAVLAFVLMLLEIRAGTFILFFAGIYGFMTVFINRKILDTLEESC